MYFGIGTDGVNAGTFAFTVAQAVANAVFGLQVAEHEAFHGTFDGGSVYPKRVFGTKPLFPWGVVGQFINIVFGHDCCMRYLYQNTGCQS